MDLKKNADGSVDVYCGPKVPKGIESNWIPTVAGRNLFSYFRLYEPTQPYFDRAGRWAISRKLSGRDEDEKTLPPTRRDLNGKILPA